MVQCWCQSGCWNWPKHLCWDWAVWACWFKPTKALPETLEGNFGDEQELSFVAWKWLNSLSWHTHLAGFACFLFYRSQIICGSHYCSLYYLASTSTIMNFYQAKLHVANQGTQVRFALICLLPHHRSRFFHFNRQERPMTPFPPD
jgi:hypothetical protein